MMDLELAQKLEMIKIQIMEMDVVQLDQLNPTIFVQVDQLLQKTLVQHAMPDILQIQVKQLVKQYVEMV